MWNLYFGEEHEDKKDFIVYRLRKWLESKISIVNLNLNSQNLKISIAMLTVKLLSQIIIILFYNLPLFLQPCRYFCTYMVVHAIVLIQVVLQIHVVLLV